MPFFPSTSEIPNEARAPQSFSPQARYISETSFLSPSSSSATHSPYTMNGSPNGAGSRGSQDLGNGGAERAMGVGRGGADLNNLSPDEANRIIHSHRKVRYGMCGSLICASFAPSLFARLKDPSTIIPRHLSHLN